MNPGSEADLIEQIQGPALHCGIRIAGNQSRDEDVFQHGALGQQVVVLEHKADLFVAK